MESVSLLAGGVAHELNNILTALLGFGSLLAEQVAGDPDAVSNAREVLTAGERAAALTRQLLAFSRRQALAPERTDVGAVVEGIRPRLQEVVGTAVAVEIYANEDAPCARVDVARLEDALIVLARNARDAMPAGGHMAVEVDAVAVDACAAAHVRAVAGSYVRLSVADTGCGIPPDVQDRIFEPFFTTKARGKGIGLGLATVYGFVRQSGGYIGVHSERNLGTTMKIYLPVFEPTQAVTLTVPAPVLRSAAGQTVLVVDDTDAVRSLATDFLRRAGYRVLVGSTASNALSIAASQRGPIHLLLTDVVMPGSSGVDLAKELRAERRGLRVLYMSGYSDNAVVRHGLLGEGEAFLQKPFSRELLLQQVAALVR